MPWRGSELLALCQSSENPSQRSKYPPSPYPLRLPAGSPDPQAAVPVLNRNQLARVRYTGRLRSCFAVDDLEAEVARLTASGVKLRNAVMDFHSRKVVFLHGPEDITVELAQWE